MFQKLLFLTLFFVFVVSPAYAQEDTLPDPGILPGSFLYPIDRFFEPIGLMIIIDNVAKAERMVMHSDERLAEIQTIMRTDESELIEEAITAYEKKFTEALITIQNADKERKNTQAQDLLKKISETRMKHQAVLERVYAQVPDQAKPAIERAMQNGLRNHREVKNYSGQQDAEDQGQEKSKREDTETNSSATTSQSVESESQSLPSKEKNIEVKNTLPEQAELRSDKGQQMRTLRGS